jgi:hypothetical protein
MLVWVVLTGVLAGFAFVAGSRRQARRGLRAVADGLAALMPGPAGVESIRGRLAAVAALLGERDAELARMRTDRETQARTPSRISAMSATGCAGGPRRPSTTPAR